MRWIRWLPALALGVGLSGPWQQQPFKARVDVVSVSVSVKKGNNPVAGLTADDFQLFDNGVRQRVQVVSIEDVPVDVTLFLDTSGSTSNSLDDMKTALQKIAAKLRPGDRFRLLTIGVSVYSTVSWTDAGTPFGVDMTPVSGISLIYDAVAAAIRHTVALGRRHLVVALTDGRDCGSIVKPALLLEAAKRSEAVIHWVEMGGAGGPAMGTSATCFWAGAATTDNSAFKQIAESTGGAKRSSLFGVDPVKEFDQIFSEFRQSYVLSFSPIGVDRAGWHAVRVQVPKGKYSIDARPGYVGG